MLSPTLCEQAASLARRMRKAGFTGGERIALIAETDGDFVRAFCACTYAGIVPVPLPLPMAFGGRDRHMAHIRGMLTAARVLHALLLGPIAHRAPDPRHSILRVIVDPLGALDLSGNLAAGHGQGLIVRNDWVYRLTLTRLGNHTEHDRQRDKHRTLQRAKHT